MRQALGLVIALVAAVLVSTVIEYLAHMGAGTRPGTIAPVPAGMAAVVLLGWIAGTFAGAVAGNAIAARIWPGYTVAVLIAAAAVYTILQTAHPWWVWIGGIAGPLVAAWIAARLPLRRA